MEKLVEQYLKESKVNEAVEILENIIFETGHNEVDYILKKTPNTIEVHFDDINIPNYHLEEIGEYMTDMCDDLRGFDVLEGDLADPYDSNSVAGYYLELQF